MQYIVANKGLALQAGFPIRGHRTNATEIILNEKELMFKDTLSAYPTLREKAEALQGTVYSHYEIMQILNNYE